MDERIREFVQRTAMSIAGIDVVLFYQANPSTFDTANGIALRTHRKLAEVQTVLDRLVQHGILEQHSHGAGGSVCYGLSRARAVWDLLCAVSGAYLDDPETRKEMVRALLALQDSRPPAG